MIQKILGILKPFLPLIVTGGVILCCAAAPAISEIPARKEAPDSSELDALLQEVEDVRAEQAAAQTETPEEEPETTPETKKKTEPDPDPEPEVAEELAAGTGDYEDGVYTGSGTGFGGTISVQVTVKDAQITDITILSASGETSSFLSKARGVIQSILTAQTWEVDAVSGATYSSNGIKAAVKNALTGEVTASSLGSSKVATGNAAALTQVAYVEPEGYQDGSYTGSAQGFGGTITVQVTIAEGKLTDVQVVSAPGETSSYLSRAMSVVDTILTSQSPNVDTVSGATYSSSGIINATKNALASASGSDPAAETDPEASDGDSQSENETADTPSDEQQPENSTEQTSTPADPENPEKPGDAAAPVEPESTEKTDDTPAAENPENPEETEQPGEPAVTTETSTETYSGSGTVMPDEYGDFEAYGITVTVTVSVTVRTTVQDGVTTIETTRKVTDIAVSGAAGSNASFTARALGGMQASLIGSGTADTVAGATCSSAGIRAAYEAAISGVELGTTTETVEQEARGGADER